MAIINWITIYVHTSSYADVNFWISFWSIKKRPIPATEMAFIAMAIIDSPRGICSWFTANVANFTAISLAIYRLKWDENI